MVIIITKLEEDLQITLDWFKGNGMYANPEKFQMMFLGFKINNSFCLNIDRKGTKQIQSVKLLGIHIDNKLFDMHVKELCQKISQKLCSFSRIRPFLNKEKAEMLPTSVFMSNFSHCFRSFVAKLLRKI